MASTPPSGFGYWALTIQTAGAPHLSVVTCGFQNGALYTASQANIQLRAVLAIPNSPFAPANMASAFTVISSYVLINTGAGLYVDTNITPIVGTKTLQTPPLNTALVVKKNTILAGRQYRGRFLAPPMNVDEAQVSIAGIISGTSLSNATTQWNSLYTTLVTNNLQPVLLHETPISGVKPAPTTISSFSITPLIGTIKRRIRS